MVIPFGPILRTGIEIFGPIVLREVSKPRFRKFVEQKVEDISIDLGQRIVGKFRKRTKNDFIIRRGKQNFHCRRMR